MLGKMVYSMTAEPQHSSDMRVTSLTHPRLFKLLAAQDLKPFSLGSNDAGLSPMTKTPATQSLSEGLDNDECTA